MGKGNGSLPLCFFGGMVRKLGRERSHASGADV